MNIGLKIRNRRIELGLTQEEFAKKCGYKDRTMISKIENNETDFPISKLVMISQILECDPNYLLDLGYVKPRELSSEAALSDISLLSKLDVLSAQNRKMVSDIIDVVVDNQYSK